MKKILDSLSRNVHRQGLVLKKNSPHIFFGVGVVGVVTSTVLACRATLRLSETLDDIQKDISNVKETKVVRRDEEEYIREEYGKDAVYVYAKASLKLAALYAPSAIIGVGSIALLAGSHVQMTRRNAALTAAYGILQKAYEEYRERVREELGEEKERDLYLGVRTDTEAGSQRRSINPEESSAYSKVFSPSNKNWSRDGEYVSLFLTTTQAYANDRLIAHGHVFLNEVYDMLGFDRTPAGAVVGWLYNGGGDNYINFHYHPCQEDAYLLATGADREILLDFNVDGIIYDKI